MTARRELVALLDGLADDQWQRQGTHALYGGLTLLDLLVFVEWHDVNHLEQIARTLGLSAALL